MDTHYHTLLLSLSSSTKKVGNVSISAEQAPKPYDEAIELVLAGKATIIGGYHDKGYDQFKQVSKKRAILRQSNGVCAACMTRTRSIKCRCCSQTICSECGNSR
jgi:hypothetical protein